jgi:hypothetical protein
VYRRLFNFDFRGCSLTRPAWQGTVRLADSDTLFGEPLPYAWGISIADSGTYENLRFHSRENKMINPKSENLDHIKSKNQNPKGLNHFEFEIWKLEFV